jgi:glycosyltransferase involved in cell wall biosynthesis
VFSVVIPAYNEAAVIGRCLNALLQDTDNQFEIIVVCNGCHDNTAEIASGFAGVTVIETDVASKSGALNLGDQAARYFPRVFLDADIRLTGKDLVAVVERMNKVPNAKVGAPTLEVDYSFSSWAVKAFYRVWTAMPYFKSNGMVGSGIYILSEAGRADFPEFPNIIGDDAYVRALFKPEERYTDSDYHFMIYAPRNLSDLVKIKTRARFGNLELNQKYPELVAGKDHNAGSLANLLAKEPRLLLSSIVYVYVQLTTMRKAKKRLEAADFTTWERDDSGRLAPGDQ